VKTLVAIVLFRDLDNDDAGRDNFEYFGESIIQGVNNILAGLSCGRRNSGGRLLGKKGRGAQGATKNKSKQKSHELEFRHDRAGGCSKCNLALQARHLYDRPPAVDTGSSRAQARDPEMLP